MAIATIAHQMIDSARSNRLPAQSNWRWYQNPSKKTEIRATSTYMVMFLFFIVPAPFLETANPANTQKLRTASFES
jgi:hypothetical protein